MHSRSKGLIVAVLVVAVLVFLVLDYLPPHVFTSGQGEAAPPLSLQRKMQCLQAQIEEWQGEGKDPKPIGEILMREFRPLVERKKFKEAEAVLDQALKVAGGTCTDQPTSSPDTASATQAEQPPSLYRKRQCLQAQIEKWQEEGKDLQPIEEILRKLPPLMDQQKFAEAEHVVDRALEAAGGTCPDQPTSKLPVETPAQAIALQPFADQVRDLGTTLAFLGQPLSQDEQKSINAAFANSDPEAAVAQAQALLDKNVLVIVTINAESRVSVKRGSASADLVQDGVRLFLVKVVNLAGVTSALNVTSPNSRPVYIRSSGNPTPPERISPEDVRERWAGISLYTPTYSPQDRMEPSARLTGFGLEYRILLIYSRDAGERSAKLSFDVGQGTQDVGFLNETTILFKIAAAHPIKLHVLDADGRPTMASFIFKDHLGRIYPSPTKRLAPDFFFQPQIYRANGENISLPQGSYTVTETGGPEYITESRQFKVDDAGPKELSFRLKRWINPAQYAWYSGDHHIHAAGCSHYENPSQGVKPEDMDRQVRGEHLNVGCVLTWAPCYYYQKQFYRGRHDNPLSTPSCLLHYDLEVSGFPSSHAGHLVLLNLREQDYPGTTRIEDWPTWDLPILRWGKSQGATVGFAHSGWGLDVKSQTLPNYEVPGFDGIGANEYIVDVTYPNIVDFISAGDTPYVWELNIWYQTLSVGMRTRIAGETDFPCIYDTRVGEGRTYAKVDGPLTYDSWMAAIRAGHSYVSDGRSHLMDFMINGTEVGTHGSEVALEAPGTAHVQVNAAAFLDPAPDEEVRQRPYDQKPYWDLERARIGDTRTVPVEVVMNGRAVARKELVADGTLQKLQFDVPIRRSSWLAVRILPSSHTNPIFVLVDGKPVQASCRSAQWCLDGVNQCWSQKVPRISSAELPEAREAYDHARHVYQEILSNCTVD